MATTESKPEGVAAHHNPLSPTATAHVNEYDIEAHLAAGRAQLATKPWWYRLGVNAWTQIVTVTFACFCLPGMYNAISGMGGSGQLDPTVSTDDLDSYISSNRWNGVGWGAEPETGRSQR
jgi:hypothetical protein